VTRSAAPRSSCWRFGSATTPRSLARNLESVKKHAVPRAVSQQSRLSCADGVPSCRRVSVGVTAPLPRAVPRWEPPRCPCSPSSDTDTAADDWASQPYLATTLPNRFARTVWGETVTWDAWSVPGYAGFVIATATAWAGTAVPLRQRPEDGASSALEGPGARCGLCIGRFTGRPFREMGGAESRSTLRSPSEVELGKTSVPRRARRSRASRP
jgi:hypothetical protein